MTFPNSDNMEWFSGKVVHFGLQYINWSDPMLTRTPKASMFQVLNWFKCVPGFLSIVRR